MVDRALVGKESQERGKRFEDLMRRSWLTVSGSWRLRLKDGAGSERPGDELVLLTQLRLLIESKATSKDVFRITANIKPHQLRAGVAFSRLSYKNKSIVFIHFEKSDKTYVVAMHSLVKYMKEAGKKSVHRDEILSLEFSKEVVKKDQLLYLKDIQQEILEWK